MNVSESIKVKVAYSLEERIKGLIRKDYSMITGDKVRDMFAHDLINLIAETYRDPYSLEVGQLVWIAVDEQEKPRYGNTAQSSTLVPVTLTPIHKDDLALMTQGNSHREIREQKIVRLFQEAKEQGSLLTNADVGMILGVSPATISKQAREYMERNDCILPTRGIVHDIGRAVTHKRIIVRLYLQGYLVPDIARKTKHSEHAVNRYIKAFNKVRMLKDRMSVKDVARTLEMSEYLVNEYVELLDDSDEKEDSVCVNLSVEN